MIRRARWGVFILAVLLAAPAAPSLGKESVNPVAPDRPTVLGIAGGAPGMNAVVEAGLPGGYTLIALANLDPPAAERVAEELRSWHPREAAGRQAQLQPSFDKRYKVKNKGGVERVRDKSKPVRAALEAQYAKMVEAYRNDDPTVVLELRTPDFSVLMPSGERWDAEQSAAYVRAGFDQVEKTLDLSFTIEELDVHDDTAAAMIHQRWSRMQMKQGQLRRVETSACQRETWIDTPEGWRLHLIDRVQPLVWVIDGKRVDPSKPYDPDAPPYAPEVEPTSPCTD